MKIRGLLEGAALVTVSAALIAVMSLLGLFIFAFSVSNGGRDWSAPMNQISDALNWDGTSYRFEGKELLEDRWAMLLNEEGELIWSFRKPEELPDRYSILDVASFARWYLEDYPVLCWVRQDGLLVVGSPKGSVWKHDIAMETNILLQTPFWFLGFFLLALGGVLSLAWLVVRRWFWNDQRIRDKARSGWINGISHDIRTPLAVVMGYAAQMESAPDLPPERKRQATAIRAQSQVIRDLVNDLNLTMRLDCEMQALRKEVLQPAAFLRQIAADFLNGGMAEGFDFEMDLPETPLPAIEADPFLLRRAVNNLLSNCVRHNAPGSSVRMGAEIEGDKLVFWVEGGTAGKKGQETPAQGKEAKRPEPAHSLDPDGGAAHGTGLRLVAQIAAAHKGKARFSLGELSRCEILLPYGSPQRFKTG